MAGKSDKQEDDFFYGKERRFPHWWDKWVNPTTVLALIGGIVWGIQLNMAVVDHTGRIGAINGRLDAQQLMLQEQATILAKTSVVLTNIQSEIKESTAALMRHEEKAQRLRQIATENSTRIETLSHKHPLQFQYNNGTIEGMNQ